MRNTILFEAVRERPVIAILSAVGIFLLSPLIQNFNTSLAFQIWFTDIVQKPASSAPYIVFSILFGMFISLYYYSKNKCIDCKKDVRTGFGGGTLGFLLGVCPACFSFIGFLLPLGGSLFLTQYSPLFMVLSIGIILFSINKMGGFKKASFADVMSNNNSDIAKSVGVGLQKIFGLEKTPRNLEQLQSLILKSHDSNKAERSTLAWIARHYVEFGTFPTTEEISKELAMNPAIVEELLREFEKKGYLTSAESGEINGAYGVSSTATPHSIVFGNKPVHVWCAIDSLGIPLTLNRDASVNSKCLYCKSPVSIRIEGQRLAEYNPNTIIFMGFDSNIQKVSEDFCPHINFFCSGEHLDQWKKNRSSIQGVSLDLQSAAEISRYLFKPFGESNEYKVKFC